MLNSDFANYDDVKEHFYKVCNMTDAQLVMTRFKKAKSHRDALLKQAATVEYHRRKAAALLGGHSIRISPAYHYGVRAYSYMLIPCIAFSYINCLSGSLSPVL